MTVDRDERGTEQIWNCDLDVGQPRNPFWIVNVRFEMLNEIYKRGHGRDGNRGKKNQRQILPTSYRPWNKELDNEHFF